MVDELSSRTQIPFLSRQFAKKLIGGNYFPQLVNQLIIRPVIDLVLEDQYLSLVLPAEEDKIIADFD
jgi:hypothetical protein